MTFWAEAGTKFHTTNTNESKKDSFKYHQTVSTISKETCYKYFLIYGTHINFVVRSSVYGKTRLKWILGTWSVQGTGMELTQEIVQWWAFVNVVVYFCVPLYKEFMGPLCNYWPCEVQSAPWSLVEWHYYMQRLGIKIINRQYECEIMTIEWKGHDTYGSATTASACRY
jgi:hypothetical protein